MLTDVIEKLMDKDDKKAYQYCKELINICYSSDELYPYFLNFLELLKNSSSYVRTRGFILCCSLSKWDIDNKIDEYFDDLMVILKDEKPTAIRQAIKALYEVSLYKPQLIDRIVEKLDKIEIESYPETTGNLIKKDIESFKKQL